MPVTDTPLRYLGGKTQLTPFVIDLLQSNDLYGGVYAEPFAGGAGIAWRLLLNGDVTEVWLNDVDPAIFSFWDTVVQRPDEICERIHKTEITIEEWERQRLILKDSNSSSTDLAFAALFLNRTNRSGILKGGVIGGKAQNGDYKLDCRFNRLDLIQKIQRISVYKKVIKINRLDAGECLQKWSKQLPQRSLLNIDPPYFIQGRDLYLSFYKREDHAGLAQIIRRISVPWMLTYDDAPEIETLYKGLPIYRKSLIYSAQVKRRASELLVLAPSLHPPAVLLQSIAA